MPIVYPSLYDPAASIGVLYLTIYDLNGDAIRGRSQSGIVAATNVSGAFEVSGGVTIADVAAWTIWDNAGSAYPPELVTPGAGTVSAGAGAYIPIILSGPEGSPNGTLTAAPQTIVITPSGEVFVKSLGNGNEGWVQTA